MTDQTNAQQSDSPLTVGVDYWEPEADAGELAMVQIERVDADEVSLTVVGGCAVFMSKAAAREIGGQLIRAAERKW